MYRRFIDDGFGVITNHTGNFNRFLDLMNKFGPSGKQLEWTSETDPSSLNVNFLDLPIAIEDGILRFTSFSKPINLNLYLPAHSAHPYSNLSGMIYGKIRTYWLQNSKVKDFIANTQAFFGYMVARGHREDTLDMLFSKAAKKHSAEAHEVRSPSI